MKNEKSRLDPTITFLEPCLFYFSIFSQNERSVKIPCIFFQEKENYEKIQHLYTSSTWNKLCYKICMMMKRTLFSLLILFALQNCDGSSSGKLSQTETNESSSDTLNPESMQHIGNNIGNNTAANSDASDSSIFSFIPKQSLPKFVENDFIPDSELGAEVSPRFVVVMVKEGATEKDFQEIRTTCNCTLGGTIPEIGVFQLDYGQGNTLEQMKQRLTALRQHPAIEGAFPDIKLKPQTVPNRVQRNSHFLNSWTWEKNYAGPNWGFELIRIPSVWSLNDVIKKTNGVPIQVAVLDSGFYAHPDLAGILRLDPGTTYGDTSLSYSSSIFPNRLSRNGQPPFDEYVDAHNHGTAVAGIIAAQYGNSEFTDGITPFAELVGYEQTSTFSMTLAAFYTNERILNISLGYSGVQTQNSIAVVIDSGMRSVDGMLFGRSISWRNDRGRPLLVVSAAGNDSADPSGVVSAATTASSNWAAKYHPLESVRNSIVIVEGLYVTPLGYPHRGNYSNIDGTVFAPADGHEAPQMVPQLPSAANPNGPSIPSWVTKPFVMTSGAAPFVTGLAAYMLALQPDLTNEELQKLLTYNTPDYPCAAPQSGGASSTNVRIDAFSATQCLCKLPRFHSNCRLRTWQADLNNKSLSGAATHELQDDGSCGADISEERELDGVVDLRDFRVLRNISLMTARNAALNRCSQNLNLDFNRDGKIESPQSEVWPLADLNADGIVDNTKQLVLDEQLSDVEVFMNAFDGDSVQGWKKADFPDLLNSADLWIRAQEAITELGATSLEVVEVKGDVASGDTVPTDVSPLQRGHHIATVANPPQ